MSDQELLRDLVGFLKEDECFSGRDWQSMTYYDEGGVALRRYKYYAEQLFVNEKNSEVDLRIYISLADNLTVFNGVVAKLQELSDLLRKNWGNNIRIEYKTEPARNKAQELKGSMSLAHFFVPSGNKDMLRDVYKEVSTALDAVEKGEEVKLRRNQKSTEETVMKELELREEVNDATITELHLRPIPQAIEYPTDIKQPNEIGGVISWVTSIEALFDRKEIVLSDGRMMRPGNYIIPPYQRKYAWSYDNVSQLCRDLFRSADEGKESYHLGTIILHHQPGEQGDSFYVVDGQQRLTTISYLINSEIFAGDTAPRKIRSSDVMNILGALEEYQGDKERILKQLKHSTLVIIAVSEIDEAFQLFSTQNGRGRPLTPANLLKAYHLHELVKDVDGEKSAKEIDRNWEANNAEKIRDGRLLSQVLSEHLYRLRCWSRGEFPKEQFSNAKIKEFKGITFNTGNDVGVPAQNMMKLRRQAVDNGDYYLRTTNDEMNPLSMIDQPIVNGADFFDYMKSYAEAYRVMFGTKNIAEMQEFRNFYAKNCTYKLSGRRGDTYARHIFESLSLFCYDRFGIKGLCACARYLYRCAYYERAVKSRCYYSTCGAEFAIRAVRAMTACMTLSDVKDRLHALNGAVLELYRKEKKIFSGKPVPDGIAQVRSVFEN